MKKVSYKLKIIITIMIVFSLIVSYVNVISADKKIETVAYKKTPVGAHGRLNVKGTKLVDQYGKEIQNSRCFYSWNQLGCWKAIC